MTKTSVPKRLWDFGYNWICETGNLSVSSSKYAQGCTPVEIIIGETPDISEYTDFSFMIGLLLRKMPDLVESQLED